MSFNSEQASADCRLLYIENMLSVESNETICTLYRILYKRVSKTVFLNLQISHLTYCSFLKFFTMHTVRKQLLKTTHYPNPVQNALTTSLHQIILCVVFVLKSKYPYKTNFIRIFNLHCMNMREGDTPFRMQESWW